MERSRWTFRIKDEAGVVLCHLVDAENRVLKRGLNKAGEASFSYDLKKFADIAQRLGGRSIDDLSGLARSRLEVLRDSAVLWGGELLLRTKRLSATERSIELKALGHLARLDQRHAALLADDTHTAKDAGQIIVDTINELQAETYGDMGFTFATVTPSVNRTMTVSRTEVSKLFDDLSGANNGFDFTVSADKVITIYYPMKGADKTELVEFKYPGNIDEIEEVADAKQLANYVIAYGKGDAGSELTAVREDVDSEASSVGKRTKIITAKDIDNATVLGDIAQQALNESKSIPLVYKIKLSGTTSPTLDMYDVGDIVKVTVLDDAWSFTQSFRIFEITVDIDDKDNEGVTIVAGLVGSARRYNFLRSFKNLDKRVRVLETIAQ